MLLVLFAPIVELQAQYVSGVIKDDNGPVEGAYIRFSPRGGGTTSGPDGYYRLKVPQDHDSLEIVCLSLGHKTLKIPYTGKAEVDLFLTRDAKSIAEVKVAGLAAKHRAPLGARLEDKDISKVQPFRGVPYVSGVVKDNKGPVEGAYIRFSPRGGASMSDQDGRYRLKVPKQGDSLWLICQCMGYRTVKIPYKGGVSANFTLKEESKSINEVVVRSRANINAVDVRARTGNVEKVNIQRLQSKPVSDIGLALQGMVPGLQVINRGALGEQPEIRIRGTSSFRKGDKPNQPLYVLDGQIISTETFLMLNPDDLGEIKVLKDAVGTALYGIRAANGVVEISSRRFSGDELHVSYRGEGGITFRGKRAVEMMDSEEKLELEHRLQSSATPGYLYSEDYIKKTWPSAPNLEELISQGQKKLDSLKEINTDWYRELIRPSYYHRHSLSLRGGKGNTSYSLSAGFMQQGGQVDGNSLLRGNSRLSLEQRFSDNAVLGVSISGGYSKVKTPYGSDYNPLELVYNLNPYESKDSPSLWSYSNRRFNDLMGQFKRTETTKNVSSFVNFNWRIIEGLEVDAICGLDLSLHESLRIKPATSWSEMHSGVSPEQRGELLQAKNVDLGSTTGLRINYTHTWGAHDFTIGADVDFHTNVVDALRVSGHGLYGNVMSAAAIDNSIEGSRRAKVGATKYTHRDVGLGALIGYTLLEQYDVFGTVKFDAASLLPKKHRWNQAWAVGIGWDIKKYPGLRDANWLKTLKLRASMGYTANLNGVSASSTINTFYFSPSNYAHVRPMTLEALANLHLKAEQNEIYDIGLSLGFPRINLSLSLYRRITKEALLDKPIPPSHGFASQLQNVGSLQNEGIEASLHSPLIDNNNWRLALTANMGYNRSKVLHLNGAKRVYSSLESIVPDYEVGQPTDGVWGFEGLGIHPLYGYPMFKDANGVVRSAYFQSFRRDDYIWLGHSTPPITGGFSVSVGWQNLSLDCDFYYAFGSKRMISYAYVRNAQNIHFNAIKNQIPNTWWEPGDDGKLYPSPNMLSQGYEHSYATPNTRTIRRTDFVRLSALSLRYRFDERLLSLLRNSISYGHMAIQAANLFTFTPFIGSDPETGNLVAPLAPVVTFNLSISF